MIRITCHCCHGSQAYKDFSSMNVQIAMGLYVESDEGPICADCYAMIQSTQAYVDTTAKIRELRISAMRESIRQVQQDNNYTPPEVRSLH